MIVFTITPVTLPASEFHDTRSPRRNLRPMGFLPEQAARIHRPLPLTFPLPVRNVLAGRAAGLANHAPIEREVESPHRPASLARSGTTGYEIRQRHSKTSAPETADGIHR